MCVDPKLFSYRIQPIQRMKSSELTLERANKSLSNFRSVQQLDAGEQEYIDNEFWMVMISIFREEKIFFTQMHNDWSTMRTRLKGCLIIFGAIPLLFFFGNSPVIGALWLVAVIGCGIRLNQIDTGKYVLIKKLYPTDKESVYYRDMAAYDQIKTLIEQAQNNSQVGKYPLIQFEDIYQDVRLSVDRAQDRIKVLVKDSWIPILRTGSRWPHYSSKEVNIHEIHLKKLEDYLEQYRSIRFPNMPPHVSYQP